MHMLMNAAAFIAALVGAMAGLMLILPLGLAVHEFVIFPLALGVAALLAALGAAWTGTLLAQGQSRTRLMPVVGVAEATAVLLAILVLANSVLRLGIFDRLIYLALAIEFILALAATVGMQAFRRPGEGKRDDLRWTLLLLGMAILLVPIVVYVASLFGLTGA